MGNSLYKPDIAPPEPDFIPKYDPMLGFPNGRKERIVITTIEEMESAHVPPDQRDYCVDKYMEYLVCRGKNYPLMYRCKHEVHAYDYCQHQDLVLRMKEYEREKRLDKLAAKKNIEMEE